MHNWKQISIGEFVDFNPSEKITLGSIAKKIPMAMLTEFERKIRGFEFAPYQSGPKFRNGDTLVAKITPCLENGKTAQVDILDENEVAFGSSEFIVLRENEHSINDYIFYLARSPVFRERAISCMEGTSGRKRVNEGALERQEIIVPDKKTQQKIAAVLSALDNKIELNNQINAELEAMAKTLYDYWFVQFDFPDQSGRPYKSSGGTMVWNEHLKREIPEGWEVKKIGEVLARVPASCKVETKEYQLFGKYPIIDQSTKFIAGYTDNEKSFIEAKLNPVIVFGDHTRILKFINFDFARGADGTQILISNNDKMPQHLFYFTLSKFDLSNYGYARHFKFLKEQLILLPRNNQGSLFEKFVEIFYRKVLINQQQNQTLSTLRDWLLPMLMNGQLSVGEAYEKVAEAMSVAAEGEEKYLTSKSPS